MKFGKKIAVAVALTAALAGVAQLQEETEVQVAAEFQEEAKPLLSVPVILPPL